MAIKTIDKTKCSDKGASGNVICPECKKEVEMRIFESKDMSLLPRLLDKEATQVFAVCPQCTTVYNVNPEYIKAKDAGMTVFPTSDDFTKVERS